MTNNKTKKISVEIISDELLSGRPGRQLTQRVNEVRAEISSGLSLSALSRGNSSAGMGTFRNEQ